MRDLEKPSTFRRWAYTCHRLGSLKFLQSSRHNSPPIHPLASWPHSNITTCPCATDLDTIDVSNLNRQFLFRAKDVGRGKAETAAEFIMNKVPGCTVIPHTGRIQDFDEDFYRQFQIIVSGLDNIEARRWLNSVIVGMVGSYRQLQSFLFITLPARTIWIYFKRTFSFHLRLIPSISRRFNTTLTAIQIQAQ